MLPHPSNTRSVVNDVRFQFQRLAHMVRYSEWLLKMISLFTAGSVTTTC